MAYFSTAVLTKTSISLLYNRLFGIYGRFRHAIIVTETLVLCYFVTCVPIALGGCHPISYFWNKDQEGWCLDEIQFFRWNGVANLLLDVLILTLPMPMVWNLHLRTKQKVALTGIFCLGGLSVSSCCMLGAPVTLLPFINVANIFLPAHALHRYFGLRSSRKRIKSIPRTALSTLEYGARWSKAWV
jgi:hypothetical protein